MPPSAAVTLPMELIFTEILPRLPARTLLRLKCVCKLWQTQISSSEFINLHLHHSNSSSSDSNTLLILSGPGLCYTYLLDSPRTSALKLSFPQCPYDILSGFSVIGSCNGLVCIKVIRSFSNNLMILLNPSTGFYKEITMMDGHRWDLPGKFGFGFDKISDDYKVVAIVDHVDNLHLDPYDIEYVEVCRCREVWVYSFKTDSWRMVETMHPKDFIMYAHACDGVLTEDHLIHWSLWHSSKEDTCIRCFDLRNEQWAADIPLFSGFFNENEDVKELGVLDGCLCMTTLTWNPNITLRVDVWVMKEYGVQESWVKLWTLSNMISKRSIYCKGLRSENFFMVEDPADYKYDDPTNYKFMLLCHNVVNRTTKITQFTRPRDGPFFKVQLCRGSLVTVPGGTNLQRAVGTRCVVTP